MHKYPRRPSPNNRPLIESLESRLLLTAYVNTDIAATWGYSSMSSGGSVSLDAANNITGVSVTPRLGPPVTPTGTYTLSPIGALSLTSPQIPGTGAVNVTKDVFATSEVGTADSLALAVKPGATPYANKDINGTWRIFFNADTSTATGFGKITLSTSGKITDGSWTTSIGKNVVVSGGTYTLAADGSVTFFIKYEDPSNIDHVFSFTGQVNASKDVIAQHATDLTAATATGNSILATMVRSTNKTFSKSDAVGTWTVVSDGVIGSIQMDSDRNLTGTITDSSGTHRVFGTTYITDSGSFKVFLTFGSLGGIQTAIGSGYMDRSKNFITLLPSPSQADAPTNSANTLTYLVLSNHPPKLSSIKSFKTATAGAPFTIAGSALLAASNAKDADGDPLSFVVTAINAGTLQVNHIPAVANTTVIHPGDEVEWTPSFSTLGNTTAFTVKAFDGADTSDTAVAVKIKVKNLPPTFTKVDNLTGATKNTDFAVTYATLLAASDAVDPEGGPITFEITGITSGSLKKNGTAVDPGETLLSPGDVLTWTPPNDATGTLAAFIVAASDGVNLTASRQVSITVVP